MPNQRLNIDLQLILHDFLKKLREEGFSIGMNTYIESTQLLHWFLLERKSNSIEDFSSYLSPLICKHDDEQRRFKSLFDRYISKSFNDVIESERIKLANERKELRRKYFIGVGVVLALLLLTWVVVNILRHEHNFKSEKFAEQEFLYHRNQPVDFDRSILFENRRDTADYDIQSTFFRSGEKLKGAAGHIQFPEYGRDSVVMEIECKKCGEKMIFESGRVYVGPEFPLSIKAQKEEISPGEKNVYEALIDSTVSKNLIWTISDVDRVLDQIKSSDGVNWNMLEYAFTDPGQYEIHVSYEVIDSVLQKFPEEYYNASYSQTVYSPDQQLTSVYYPPDQITTSNLNKGWLFSLLTFAGLLFMGLIYNLRKKKPKQATDQSPDKFDGAHPPYELQFISRDQNISTHSRMVQLSNELKKRTESQAYFFDIPKTIKSSIQRFEFFLPQFSRKQVQREYLFLIDQDYVNSQQTALFNYLSKYFIKHMVKLDFYFFQQLPNEVYKEIDGPHIKLGSIKDAHYNHELIVISDGFSFIDGKSPVVNTELISLLSYWQNRILLTPVNVADWGSSENILSSFFKILPADMEGLVELVRAIDEDEYSESIFNRQKFYNYEAKYVNFSSSDSLRKYLDRDEDLFQWLCAMAIHPKVYWEVLLEFGKVIVKDKLKINYTTLLKLVRIRWLHEGSIPPQIRLMLLKELTIENELLARNTFLHMLDEFPFGDDAFSYEEKQISKYANSFVLFASGKSQFQNNAKIIESKDQFISLYKSKQLIDNPLLIYLEKKKTETGGWKTPVKESDANVGLEEYIETRGWNSINDLKKWNLKQKQVTGGLTTGLFAVGTVIMFLLINPAGMADTKTNQLLSLVDTTNTPVNNIEIRILPPECKDVALAGDPDVKSTIEILSGEEVLAFTKVDVADTTVLTLNEEIASMMLSKEALQDLENSPLKAKLQIEGRVFETIIEWEAGIYNLQLEGKCRERGIANYYPGYRDDTLNVISTLRSYNYIINTFNERNFNNPEANHLVFNTEFDSVSAHLLARDLLSSGFPLRAIYFRDLSTANNNVLEIRRIDGLDRVPVMTKDQVDCEVLGFNCNGIKPISREDHSSDPEPPVIQTVQVYVNSDKFGSKIKDLRYCIRNVDQFDVPLEAKTSNLSENVIIYYTDSFEESAKQILKCVESYFPDKEFKLRKGGLRPLRLSSTAALVYIFEESPTPQPKYSIEKISLKEEVLNSNEKISRWQFNVDVRFLMVVENAVPETIKSKPVIKGELCIENIPTSCKGFSFSYSNGAKSITEVLSGPVDKPGKYDISLKIDDFNIDRSLGTVTFEIPKDPEPTPVDNCDTVRGSFTSNSRLNPLSKQVTVQLLSVKGDQAEITISRGKCPTESISLPFGKEYKQTFCDRTELSLVIREILPIDKDSQMKGSEFLKEKSQRPPEFAVSFTAVFCESMNMNKQRN